MHPLIAVIALAATTHRNPFAYVTKPKPAPRLSSRAPVEGPGRAARDAQPPRSLDSARDDTQPPRRPDPPRFPYRFIGMFGYSDNPIVAFATDDRIVTVQAGAAIDGQFVVRNIGLESVEIGFLNDERTVRIRLGESP